MLRLMDRSNLPEKAGVKMPNYLSACILLLMTATTRIAPTGSPSDEFRPETKVAFVLCSWCLYCGVSDLDWNGYGALSSSHGQAELTSNRLAGKSPSIKLEDFPEIVVTRLLGIRDRRTASFEVVFSKRSLSLICSERTRG